MDFAPARPMVTNASVNLAILVTDIDVSWTRLQQQLQRRAYRKMTVTFKDIVLVEKTVTSTFVNAFLDLLAMESTHVKLLISATLVCPPLPAAPTPNVGSMTANAPTFVAASPAFSVTAVRAR